MAEPDVSKHGGGMFAVLSVWLIAVAVLVFLAWLFGGAIL